MRSVISISKTSYGYVLDVKGDGRTFAGIVGSNHLEYAAIAMIAIWARQRDNPDGVAIIIPADVKAQLASRCPIPWERIFNTSDNRTSTSPGSPKPRL
jgi:hypothetical protein